MPYAIHFLQEEIETRYVTNKRESFFNVKKQLKCEFYTMFCIVKVNGSFC